MTENKTWPEWKNVRKIGAGSFGTVYEIEKEADPSYHAALKVITIPHDEDELKSAYSEMADDRSVTNYFESIVHEVEQEIVVMKQFKGLTNIVSYDDHKIIKHKNDIGWDILIRMELLTPTLDYIQGKYGKNGAMNFPEEEVLNLGKDICNALELCEKSNIIHRDIKPENIFVNKFGNYVLGDFGIARKNEQSMSHMSVKGTYSYMAPEVYNGQSYGKVVDIYSLGMVMYKFLNNNRGPFLPVNAQVLKPEDRSVALKKRMIGDTPEPPLRGSERLKAVIMKAISFNPDDRYQSASEMLQALTAVGTDNTKENTVGENKTKELTEDADKTVTILSETFKDKARNDSGTKRKVKKASWLKWVLPLAAAGAAAAVIIFFAMGQNRTVQQVSDNIYEKEYSEIFESGDSINKKEPKNGSYGGKNMTIAGTDLSFLSEKKYSGLKNLRLSGVKSNNSEGLKSLTGIEFVGDSLEKLFIDKNNGITSLEPLSNMKKLKSLSVAEDKNIADYSPLSKIDSLEIVDLGAARNDNLTEDEFFERIKVLSDCKGLKALTIRNNNLNNLAFKSDFDNLQVLDVAGNNIKDFSSVSQMDNLKKLIINSNAPENYDFLFKNSSIETFNMLSNESLKSISEITGNNENKNIKEININECKNLEDLTGIEKFTNLELLYITSTKITDISALKNIKNMESVAIGYTDVKDITPLSELKNLKVLFISGLHIEDLSPLQSLNSLERLGMSGNDMKNLDQLEQLTELKQVNCNKCEKLENIKGLRNSDLTRFYVSKAPLHDLEGIEASTSMERLHISDCPITDISVVEKFSKLTELKVEKTGVNDISALRGLKKLNSLSLQGSPVSDISALKQLSDLEYLNLKETGVTQQDVAELKTVLRNCTIESDY